MRNLSVQANCLGFEKAVSSGRLTCVLLQEPSTDLPNGYGRSVFPVHASGMAHATAFGCTRVAASRLPCTGGF